MNAKFFKFLLSLLIIVNYNYYCYALQNDNCGQIIKEGIWPWIAVIRVYDNVISAKYIFGGNLITKNYVITAAYSVTTNDGNLFPKENFIISLGKTHFHEDDPETQIFSSTKIHLHENYDGNHLNNIALIQLDRSVELNDYVQPICLWKENDLSSGTIGKSIIWNINKNIIQNDLETIDVLIAANDTCEFFEPNIFKLAVNEWTFCGAIPNAKSFCKLHTGTGFALPKYIHDMNVWYLRGIISATINASDRPCAESRFIVMTDIAKYLDWISEKTGAHVKMDKETNQKLTMNQDKEIADDEGVLCGTVPLNVSPLLRKGQVALMGEFPWHTAIYRFNEKDLSYSCGGTLLSNRFIVTAAHCLTDEVYSKSPMSVNEIQLYLGMSNLGELKSTVQVHLAEELYIHPDYNETVFYNDIGIIRLRNAVKFNQYVRPICLWEDEIDIEELFGKYGTIAGWGLNEHNVLSNQLMKTDFPVVSYTTCLFQDRSFFSLFTYKNNFCAGYSNGTTACSGDSGGGMYFQKKNAKGVWQLRGIISVGVVKPDTKECHPNHYVLLTDVVKYTYWIKNVIKQN